MDASLDTLIAQLGAPDPQTRRLAVMGLDEADDPRAVAPLIAALRDPDTTVRRLAVGGQRSAGPRGRADGAPGVQDGGSGATADRRARRREPGGATGGDRGAPR